jgi:hypothetical protein
MKTLLLGFTALMLATPALAQYNGNSYTLEQMQSDNNRSALEVQQQQIWELERQQQRQRYRMDEMEIENNANRSIELPKPCRSRYC